MSVVQEIGVGIGKFRKPKTGIFSLRWKKEKIIQRNINVFRKECYYKKHKKHGKNTLRNHEECYQDRHNLV